MVALGSKFIFLSLCLTCLHHFGQVEAAARTIRVPLKSETTQGEGVFGQPVISYFAQVTLGNPPKPYKVQFDVGLDDVFVPHYSYNPFKNNLHYDKGFQCKDSSTCHRFNKSSVIDYQNNKLTGKSYEDVLTFDGVTVPGLQSVLSLRQQFLAISDASNAKFKKLPIDGFIGLGPGGSLIGNLLSAKYIDNLQFSVRFNPQLDSANGGDLILGGVDTSMYQGQIYWHPLSLSGTRWSMSLQQVTLGEQIISCNSKNCQTALSTGINEIYGPRDDVRLLYNLLNTVHQSSGLETVDCRRVPTLPQLHFFIDGIPHTLLATNYIRKFTEGTFMKKEVCYVAILPHDESTTWTLGTSFLGAYYSIFDMTYRQVGFAALK